MSTRNADPDDAAHVEDRPYHHGRLRAELLVHAHEVLRTEGAEALSLRDLARRAGVSPSAPFRHFATRTELLDALALDGYRRLVDTMDAAVTAEQSTIGKLHVLARNYVDFARRNPPLLRLMTGRRKSTWASGELGELAAHSFAQLDAVIREGQAAGQVRAGDPTDLTISAWAQIHGVASLIADGMLEPPDVGKPAPSRVVSTAVEVLFHGLRPSSDDAQ